MSWGILTSIDLYDCDSALIKSESAIKQYVKELVHLIDMKTFGDCQVIHFGSCPEVEGFTMVQMIETSLISGHFVNLTGDAYIDVFSCKAYDSKQVGIFTSSYFKSMEYTLKRIVRGTKVRCLDH